MFNDATEPSPMRRLLPAAAMLVVLVLSSTGAAIPERYHDIYEVHAEILALQASHPSIVRVDTLGVSMQDSLDIWGVKLSDNVHMDEDEPVVFYNGIHHAEEVMGLEVIMWMLDELTTNYGVDDTMTAWVNDLELYFIPVLNPEGHLLVTTDVDTIWRKNKFDNNANGQFDRDYDGVDMNHNYDWEWAQGGSDNPSSDYYRGPSPASENETQIIVNFCEEHKPVFALNYHSPRSSDGDLVYYPWYWTGYGFAPDHYEIFNVATELCNRTLDEADQPYEAVYGFANRGKARNWQYGHVGTFGYTMEILSFLCIPGGHRVDGICERVSEGSYYLMQRALDGPGITGHVTEAGTRSPVVAEVKVLEKHSELLDPRTTDPTYGRYRRLLIPGTYTVEFSAFGYETQTYADVVVDSSGYTVLDCELTPWAGVPDSELGAMIERVSPNPFRGTTTLSFTAPGTAPATLEIYSASGRLVRRLDAPTARDGSGDVVWDGTDSGGSPVSSGVYFARLTCGRQVDEAKVMLLR